LIRSALVGNKDFVAQIGGGKMPKYYFDVTDGKRLVDPSGLDCRDDHDAKAKIIAKHIEAEIPTAPVQRHVEILNEDREKVAKVPVRTDTNGEAT
jgi:hypothetical protein